MLGQYTQLQAGIANSPPATADQAGAATDADNDPATDLWRELTADISMIPTLPSPMPDSEQKKQVTTLSAFFAAIQWGAPLPAMTFHVLGAHPSVVHGLIGDSMWKECWGDKHARITTQHIIPYSILNVLKFAVERAKATPDTATLENGKARWKEARTEAAKRRERGGPY